MARAKCVKEQAGEPGGPKQQCVLTGNVFFGSNGQGGRPNVYCGDVVPSPIYPNPLNNVQSLCLHPLPLQEARGQKVPKPRLAVLPLLLGKG